MRPQHNCSLIEASGHTRGAPSEAAEELPPGPDMLPKSCETHRLSEYGILIHAEAVLFLGT